MRKAAVEGQFTCAGFIDRALVVSGDGIEICGLVRPFFANYQRGIIANVEGKMGITVQISKTAHI